MVECKGMPAAIAAAMGSLGVDVSPESPKTRTSEKLMSKRDVDYDGKVFRCEWHAKVERHRNRVHFALPHEALDGRIDAVRSKIVG